VFPEWNHTTAFNATVEETCRRREQAQRAAELAGAVAARSVSYLIKPDFGELSGNFLVETSRTPITSTSQELPLEIRQPLYQHEALHVDIYATHAATFIGHRGRNCKFWVNAIKSVSDIFVIGHPDTQGTRKVAIISWYSGGQADRERVRDLIMEFNLKTGGSRYLNCEWLDAVCRSRFREQESVKAEPGGGTWKAQQKRRRKREIHEKKQYVLDGTNDVNFYGLV
jgi:hypothetical protein